MKTFKNKNFTKRDFDYTNIVCCESEFAPDDNWVECDKSNLTYLTKLYRENDTVYYGYL